MPLAVDVAVVPFAIANVVHVVDTVAPAVDIWKLNLLVLGLGTLRLLGANCGGKI